jgi:hypothetical protein
MRNRYADRSAIEWYVKEFTSGQVEIYNAPHGLRSGSGDIFNMWDTIILDKGFSRLHFIQICEEGHRNKCIQEHDILNEEKYVICDSIFYVLLTFKKVKGRYRFKVYHILMKGKGEEAWLEIVPIAESIKAS